MNALNAPTWAPLWDAKGDLYGWEVRAEGLYLSQVERIEKGYCWMAARWLPRLQGWSIIEAGQAPDATAAKDAVVAALASRGVL